MSDHHLDLFHPPGLRQIHLGRDNSGLDFPGGLKGADTSDLILTDTQFYRTGSR